MKIILEPKMTLDYFDIFKADSETDHLAITFVINDFPLRHREYSPFLKECSTSLKCYRYFSNDNEDYQRLKNLDIDEELLNKYFFIVFPFLNKNVSFSDFKHDQYKKFILDNLNKAIMEYSL